MQLHGKNYLMIIVVWMDPILRKLNCNILFWNAFTVYVKCKSTVQLLYTKKYVQRNTAHSVNTLSFDIIVLENEMWHRCWSTRKIFLSFFLFSLKRVGTLWWSINRHSAILCFRSFKCSMKTAQWETWYSELCSRIHIVTSSIVKDILTFCTDK